MTNDHRLFKPHTDCRDQHANGSSFSRANMTESYFNETKFAESDFKDADFTSCDLRGITHIEYLEDEDEHGRKKVYHKVLLIFMRDDYTMYFCDDGIVRGGCRATTIEDYRASIDNPRYRATRGDATYFGMVAFLDACEKIWAWHKAKANGFEGFPPDEVFQIQELALGDEPGFAEAADFYHEKVAKAGERVNLANTYAVDGAPRRAAELLREAADALIAAADARDKALSDKPAAAQAASVDDECPF